MNGKVARRLRRGARYIVASAALQGVTMTEREALVRLKHKYKEAKRNERHNCN